MLPLTSNSASTIQTLVITLGGAAATTYPTITVSSYIVPNQTKPTFEEYRSGNEFTLLTTASETTIAAAPPSGSIKDIHYIAIPNPDTASITATVAIDDNGTNRTQWKGIIAAGYTGHYESRRGWYVTDNYGAEVSAGTAITQVGVTNAIIGGDFSTNPWQRGTSFPAAGAGQYTADQFKWFQSGVGVVTASKSADAPTVAQCGRLVTHCLLVDCTTIDAAIGAGDAYRVLAPLEGYAFLPLAQGAMAFQFWHKHTKTGIYCVAFRNSGPDRSYVSEYSQAVSDTWEQATVIITASPSGGTWDYTNGVGLYVSFSVAEGSTYQTTANAWQVGDFVATANQVNGLDSTANNFRIALVQLEAGSQVTAFAARSVQEELARCQRYYAKTFPIGTAPAQNAGTTGSLSACGQVVNQIINAMWQFPCRMRASPTITTYSPDAATANWSDQAGAKPTAGTNFLSDSSVSITGSTAVTPGGQHSIHATASAEL